MILEIIPEGGLGKAAPLRLNASQVVIRDDFGNPIAAAALYGQDRTIAIGSLAHDDPGFHRLLKVLGINTTTVVSTIQMPKPEPGARLLHGPI